MLKCDLVDSQLVSIAIMGITLYFYCKHLESCLFDITFFNSLINSLFALLN